MFIPKVCGFIHCVCVYASMYLCHFEELRQLRHPVKKFFVDVQSIFTLVLLHVKVFLYRDRAQGRKRIITETNKAFKGKGGEGLEGCVRRTKERKRKEAETIGT